MKQNQTSYRLVVGPVGSTLQIQYYTESAALLSRSKDKDQVVTIGRMILLDGIVAKSIETVPRCSSTKKSSVLESK